MTILALVGIAGGILTVIILTSYGIAYWLDGRRSR